MVLKSTIYLLFSFRWSQLEATVVNLVRSEFQQLQMSQNTAIEKILQHKLTETRVARKALVNIELNLKKKHT